MTRKSCFPYIQDLITALVKTLLPLYVVHNAICNMRQRQRGTTNLTLMLRATRRVYVFSTFLFLLSWYMLAGSNGLISIIITTISRTHLRLLLTFVVDFLRPALLFFQKIYHDSQCITYSHVIHMSSRILKNAVITLNKVAIISKIQIKIYSCLLIYIFALLKFCWYIALGAVCIGLAWRGSLALPEK